MNTLQYSENEWLCRLREDPDDIEALSEIGLLAARQGKLDAALLAMERAAARAPKDIDVLCRLAHIYHDRMEWEKARILYDQVLQRRPQDQFAHEGACYVAMRLGDELQAAFHREQAFQGRAVTVAPYLGSGAAIRVVLVVSAYGGNFDTRPYLDPQRYAVTKIVAEYFDMDDQLPTSDIILNAIGDADRCETGLNRLSLILSATEVPVINHPDRVLLSGRVSNNQRFADIEGVIAPKSHVVQRADMLDDSSFKDFLYDATLSFPLIVRAPGYHTGNYCERVETMQQLRNVISTWPTKHCIISEFLDIRSADGYVRKYRAMSIAGKIYPLHLAGSADWKVHYMTSAMADVSALREEEAKFLRYPEATLGKLAWTALHAINQALGLEYAGIDFGVNDCGQLIFFEANATMVITFAPADMCWEYRRMVPVRLHAAVDQLISNGIYPIK